MVLCHDLGVARHAGNFRNRKRVAVRVVRIPPFRRRYVSNSRYGRRETGNLSTIEQARRWNYVLSFRFVPDGDGASNGGSLIVPPGCPGRPGGESSRERILHFGVASAILRILS